MNAQKTLSAGIGQPVRAPLHIERAADRLDESAVDLSGAIDGLRNALAPLLGPEQPSPEDAPRVIGQSEVAERVLMRADQLRGAAAEIHTLISRLQ